MQKIFGFLVMIILYAVIVFAHPIHFYYSTYGVGQYSCLVHEVQNCYDSSWHSITDLNPGPENYVAGFQKAVLNHERIGTAYYLMHARLDGAVTPAQWTGTTAEINYSDFVLFAGHGWWNGPVFAQAGSQICATLTPSTDISFGSGDSLKWVQAASCEWFDTIHDCNTQPITRWQNSFNGVHAVMGNAAITYDAYNDDSVSGEFFKQWVTNGNVLWAARSPTLFPDMKLGIYSTVAMRMFVLFIVLLLLFPLVISLQTHNSPMDFRPLWAPATTRRGDLVLCQVPTHRHHLFMMELLMGHLICRN